MIAAHTVNQTWLKQLPTAPKGATTYPTLAQLDVAKNLVAKNWAAEVGGAG